MGRGGGAVRLRETRTQWPDEKSYHLLIKVDEEARHWVHWTMKRRVFLPLGPRGRRGHAVTKRVRYRREITRAAAIRLASVWGVDVPYIPRSISGVGRT